MDLIIHDINYKTKNEDIQVAQRTIDFLEKEAAKTQLSSILLAINNLIEQQIVIALANASPEYLLEENCLTQMYQNLKHLQIEC